MNKPPVLQSNAAARTKKSGEEEGTFSEGDVLEFTNVAMD
jgi:hypothetical protein